MAQGELGLSDDEFYTDLDAPRSEILFRYLREDKTVLLLDGPRKVNVEERETLPLAGVRVCKVADYFDRNLDWKGVLVCVMQEHNVAVAGSAFPKKTDSVPPEPPTEMPDQLDAEQFSTEVREVIPDLPWKPGTWRIYLVIGEERAEPIEVELFKNPSKDPEVAKFLESRRKPGYPPVPFPPRFGRVAEGEEPPEWTGPDVPPEVGIELAVERVLLLTEGGRAVLRGSFRLPILKRNIVVRPRPIPSGLTAEGLVKYLAKPDPNGWVDIEDQEVTAVVPIWLLITGDEEAQPSLVELQVASTDAIDGDNPVVTGVFEIDLLAPPTRLAEVQTYSIHAFSGAHASDPARMALVEEEE